MWNNISDNDLASMSSEDLSDKGFLNTFNHFTAQSIITAIFSEELADFSADLHERHQMPELITGRFSEEQLRDLQDGPLDNYVDMINNEWGQELGKQLRKRYNIDKNTVWSPELLSDYLNDVQEYMGKTFQINFTLFEPSDGDIIDFSRKLNDTMGNTQNDN